MNTRRGFLKKLVAVAALVVVNPVKLIEDRLLRPTFNLKSLPLPIIHTDYHFGMRELSVFRGGFPGFSFEINPKLDREQP